MGVDGQGLGRHVVLKATWSSGNPGFTVKSAGSEGLTGFALPLLCLQSPQWLWMAPEPHQQRRTVTDTRIPHWGAGKAP